LAVGLELRNRIELLEGAGKGVRQALHGSGANSGMFRPKVETVNVGQKTPGRIELAVDQGGVNDQLRLGVGDLGPPLTLDLAPHGLEVSRNAIHAYRERVDQVEALGVFH
jgi:hypothetical protein